MLSNRNLLSVAPMLDCTDRHFRFLIRQLTRHVLLYTEMLTIKDVLGTQGGKLEFNPVEHPVALQLGGSDPELLAQCATLAASYGYDEINLNVGCPSPKVQQGGIGACLMLQPRLVAECVARMQQVVAIPISVKCRLGVDHEESYDKLAQFVETITQEGCRKFIIHARKAWLSGLNPKQNRQIPPLEYEKVYKLKRDFPFLNIHINGGVSSFSEVERHLEFVDGVMIGRAVRDNPYLLADVDYHFYNKKQSVITAEEVVEAYTEYVKKELKRGVKLSSMTRHLLGLFQNKPRAKYWRRHLSNNSTRKGVGVEIINEAMAMMSNKPALNAPLN